MKKSTYREKALSPRDLFDRLHKSVINYDAEGQTELFATDAVWEFPFAPEGFPNRIKGRDKIVNVARTGMERSKQTGRHITGYQNVMIYETSDPGVIFAEFELLGQMSTSESYQIPYIQLLKVQNGKIVLLRDYFPGEVLKMALSERVTDSR